jgi:F-type H+-transporting ATPase subunit delta
MISERASQRYALAIFRVAEEQNLTDSVGRDFDLMRNAIRTSHELSLFIKSPIINTQKKKNVFKALFGEKVSDLTLRFVILLIAKNREGLLSDIIDRYAHLCDKKHGILKVVVHTAVKLTSAQEQAFFSRLESITGKFVKIEFTVDPRLRGGFTIRYDDTIVDASVQHQLDLLKYKLTEKVF